MVRAKKTKQRSPSKKKTFNHDEWRRAVATAAKSDSGPNSQKWQPDFEYACNMCSISIAPRAALRDTRCPGVPVGSCEGTLVRFGKGSGRGSHFKRDGAK